MGAKGIPYRKFNNIQNKLTVEDYLSRTPTNEDKKHPEYKNILKAVLNRNIKFGVDSVTHLELEGLKPTLGFEIETVMGKLDPEDYENLNIKAVHDGSLRSKPGQDPEGGEYVTGVLYGDAGFKHLYDICKVLNKFCEVDHRAAVHIHIGSLNWSEEDIVYSYILAQRVEKEMFAMLPKSRSTNEYCKPIKKLILDKDIYDLKAAKGKKFEYECIIKQLYERIFMEVSGGIAPDSSYNSRSNHPQGSKCGYNKASQRYCWLNYVTLIFNTKDNMNAKTLEIRSHSATLNYTKIKNWTKIWVAFTNFVSKNKEAILNGSFTINNTKFPVSLQSMCLYTYPKKGLKLVEYIKQRIDTFKTNGESVDFPTTLETDKTIKEVLQII